MLAHDGSEIDGYVALPKGVEFRGYAWLTEEKVGAYYNTGYAAETILADHRGTRTVFHWDRGEELKQFLIQVIVSPGTPVYRM